MNRIFIALAVVLIAAAATISLVIQRSNRNALHERSQSAQRQADQIAQLSADNERLSKLVTQLKTSQALSKEQLTELLKLRNEAGQLHGTVTEKEPLQTANAQLRAAKAKSDEQLAQAKAAPNYWPKDQLTFAGYTSPGATVKSMLWAMNNGDVGIWRSICTPKAVAQMNAEWDRKHKSEAERNEEMKAMASGLVSASDGFHVVDETMPAPDKAVVAVSFDGEGKTRKFVLRKIGTEWKFEDMILSGQD
jgi:hypothetical protein